MESIINKRATIGFILITFFLAFYAQNRYAIFSIDDWTYAFIVDKDAFNYQAVVNDDVIRQPVTSFYDAALSQSRDYFKTNGRFIIHTLVQYFCGTKTMEQFVIINSIIFALFTILMMRLTLRKIDIWSLLLLLSAIWILIPHKGMTFMGNITCSIDYLWSCTATLLFLNILEIMIRQDFRCKKRTLAIFILYAFITGSLQESFGIGLSGALFTYLIWKHKTIKPEIAATIVVYIIGVIICMATPANFRRFDDIQGAGFHINSLLGLLSSFAFILFIISIIIITKNGKLKDFIHDNYIVSATILFNLLFALFVAYNGRHQLTAINVFSLIAIFRIWMPLATTRLKHAATVILTTMAILSYYPILEARKAYHDSYMTLLERVNQSDNGIVSGKEFEEQTVKIRKNYILECNYVAVFTFDDWDFFEKSLSVYLTKGKNNQFIKEITNK